MDINKVSFQHRISAFKRCFPWRSRNLTSIALFLETPYDPAITDPDERLKASLHYELDAVGFEYGDCKEVAIDGEVKYFEIQYTQVNGVQHIEFADNSRVYEFGYIIPGQAKVTKRYEFGPTKQWVGIHGTEHNSGIVKLGIITMDPTCTPINGVKKPDPTPPEPEPQPEPVTPVTEPEVKEEEGGNNMVMILAICLSIVAVIIIVLIFLCIRKRRK